MSVKRSPRSKPERKQPIVTVVVDETPLAPAKAREGFRLLRMRLSHRITQKELEQKIGALLGLDYVEKYGWTKKNQSTTPGV